jgi:hypothetical protein
LTFTSLHRGRLGMIDRWQFFPPAGQQGSFATFTEWIAFVRAWSCPVFWLLFLARERRNLAGARKWSLGHPFWSATLEGGDKNPGRYFSLGQFARAFPDHNIECPMSSEPPRQTWWWSPPTSDYLLLQALMSLAKIIWLIVRVVWGCHRIVWMWSLSRHLSFLGLLDQLVA